MVHTLQDIRWSRSPEPIGILSTPIGVPTRFELLYSVLLCRLRRRHRHNFIPRHQSLKRHGHKPSTTSVSRVPGNLGSCTRAPAVCLESIYTVYQMQSSHWSLSWNCLLTLLLYGSYMHWNVILYNQVLDCGMFDYEPFFSIYFSSSISCLDLMNTSTELCSQMKYQLLGWVRSITDQVWFYWSALAPGWCAAIIPSSGFGQDCSGGII